MKINERSWLLEIKKEKVTNELSARNLKQLKETGRPSGVWLSRECQRILKISYLHALPMQLPPPECPPLSHGSTHLVGANPCQPFCGAFSKFSPSQLVNAFSSTSEPPKSSLNALLSPLLLCFLNLLRYGLSPYLTLSNLWA